VKTITITPQEKAHRLRTALRPSFGRDASAGWQSVQIRHKPFPELTAEERCSVLAQIAQLFRDMAEQADEERLAIAEQELAA
jgi:uncharacterized membrane protein YccC